MIDTDIKTWKDGIDVDFTERRISWLKDQIDRADKALDAQREIIEHDGENLAYRLSLDSIQSSLAKHEREYADLLKSRQFETLNFALDGNRYREHRAPAAILASFILNMQKLFDRVTQAVDTGVFSKNIPDSVRQISRLEVNAFFPSSFGVQFVVRTLPDLTGHSTPILALENLLSLANTDHPIEEISRLGPRALRQYRSLVKTLVDGEVEPKVSWKAPSGKAVEWRADYHRLTTLDSRLAHIQHLPITTKEETGRLIGASIRRQRFEFAGDTFISGMAPRELESKITDFFNKICTITYSETVTIDDATEQERKQRTLLDIRDK